MKRNKKYTYEEVKEYIESLGYMLLSDIYINSNTKLIFKDKEGYYYTSNLNNLKNSKSPWLVHTSNPYSLQNIKLWLKLNNKPYILVTDNYDKNNISMVFKDSLGYYYVSSWANLYSKSELKKFHILNPYTLQNIMLWSELNNKPFQLLEGQEYNGNDKKLKWKCLKENCKEIFKASWKEIQQGSGCGFCHGLQVGLSNCLATKNPELALEWHPIKNRDITPYDVTCGSNKKIWWQCKKNHEWQATVSNRSLGNGCPYCSGRYVTKENNLLLKNPQLCKEWHYKKNNNNPEEYLPSSDSKVWWKCKKCSYEWQATINNRSKCGGTGCPKCSKKIKRNTKTFKEEIYQLYKNEYELIGEYKNSNASVSFRHTTCGNCFNVTPSAFINGAKCPFCNISNYKNTSIFKYQINKIVGGEYEVVGEYVDAKTKILLKHNKCDNYFYITPTNFISGQRCPRCFESKGEKEISRILTEYKVLYDSEYTFNNLVGVNGGLLRFDKAVFSDKDKTKLRMLVEYDGIFHYKKQYDVDGFETLKIHDKLKDDYCKNNNIKLLRIPYWDFDNIEEILKRELIL